jgi:cytochrome P450
LATVFSFLLTHPAVLEKLRGELETRFDTPDGPLDTRVLADIPYLDAVINEAFRLTPPLFSPRVVPQAGVTIDKQYIPGGTIAVVSAYTQQTSPDNFWPDPLVSRQALALRDFLAELAPVLPARALASRWSWTGLDPQQGRVLAFFRR